MSAHSSSDSNNSASGDSSNAQGSRWIWIALFAVGAIGLACNMFLRQDGLAIRHVEITSAERVQARVVIGAGADSLAKPAQLTSDAAPLAIAAKIWVEPQDPRFATGEITRVDGVAPVIWETQKLLTRKEAAANEALQTHGDGKPAVVGANELATAAPDMQISFADTFGVWIAAFLTLAIFSFLYRDNPIYKVAESLLVGVSAAYWMVNGFWTTLVPNLFAKIAPDLVRAYAIPGLGVSEHPQQDMVLAFVPLTLGFMLLWRLAPKGGWISVWPLAFIIGTTAGLKLVASIEADLIAQAAATMKPLVAYASTTDSSGNAVRAVSVWSSIGSIVGIVGVLSVLVYFFFSIEHKGLTGKAARVGIWFLMITFGSAFGLTVMGRITLLAQRLEFLFYDWLNLS